MKQKTEKYLYVMQCQNYIKLGISNNPDSRVAELQTGNPFKIKLVTKVLEKNARDAEKYFHKKFQDRRISGEWFEITDSIKQCVKDIHKLAYERM